MAGFGSRGGLRLLVPVKESPPQSQARTEEKRGVVTELVQEPLKTKVGP